MRDVEDCAHYSLKQAGPDGENIDFDFERGEDEVGGVFYMALLDNPQD